MTPFAVRLGWRETRAGWRQFTALFACVALGVAALTAVGGFAAGLDRALGREARALHGGDVELRATRPLPDAAERGVGDLVAAGAVTTRVRELAGMARDPRSGASQLVEVKAVDSAYPLYGRLETSPAAPAAALLRDGGALVEPALLARLGLRAGDPLDLGAARLVVRGIVTREPDRAGRFIALGPRVLVAAGALDATGLLQRGSRVRYRTLLRLPSRVTPAAARAALVRRVDDPTIRVTTFDESQPGLRRFFRQLTTYLGLVGLASLLVGGIGVAAAVRAFIRRKLTTIAILKTLGATWRTLLAAYLGQAVALGALGSTVGAALGIALQPLVARLVAGVVPIALDGRADAGTVARGLAMGALVTLLCALWPLLEIRTVPPSLILRRDVTRPPALARRPWPVALLIALGLAGLAVWQAGSWKVGGLFVGAALAALLLLAALARALAWAPRLLPRPASLAWRQGLANLRRPGGHAAGVVVALGVGVMLLVAVGLLEAGLGAEIDHERKRDAPSFFFVDVQADQRDAFARTVRDAAGVAPALTAIVRARLAAVNGRPVDRAMFARQRAASGEDPWWLTRDYALTTMTEPPANNPVTRGHWWTAAEAAGRPLVSVEEGAARKLGVDVGGTLTFDVQGVPIDGTVASLRKVDWSSLAQNFFVIFSPGALDGAPTTWIATARVPPAAEARVQDAVAAAFPNVTAIPVRDILERVAGVLDRIAFAVRAVALFCIGAGLVVTAGSLAASRYQRLAESVILRTLGATRGAVARIFAVEYACLGAAAGLGGTALATALAWIVLRFVLDVPWPAASGVLVLGLLLATAVAVAVGFLATFRLLGEKPLPVLRRE